MKKLFFNSIGLVLLLSVLFTIGTIWGRYSTTTVTKLTINDVTEKPIADESKEEEKRIEDTIIGDKININTADAGVFTMFPGIGDILADRIIQYRDEHGPFESVDDLLNVEGIGESKLETMRPYLTVD